VLITALGSWGKPVPFGHREGDRKGWDVVLITRTGQLRETGPPQPHCRRTRCPKTKVRRAGLRLSQRLLVKAAKFVEHTRHMLFKDACKARGLLPHDGE
jgi:hypothetical protein